MERLAEKEPRTASHPHEGDDDVVRQFMLLSRLKHTFEIKAASEGVTQQDALLQALREAGFDVADNDLYASRKGEIMTACSLDLCATQVLQH